MKKYSFLLVAILFCFNSAKALELAAGDVLLISFNCYECRVIESETNSAFSHSGVIIKNEAHQLMVGQSLGMVSLFTLDQFLKNIRPGTKVAVYRPLEFMKLKKRDRAWLEDRMLSVFNSAFNNSPFDNQYLWNNFDKNGREYLYCSEFIAKFLDHFLSSATVPYPLSYKKNEAYWLQYFHGHIPEGVLGNSPASFSYDPRFTFIGNL